MGTENKSAYWADRLKPVPDLDKGDWRHVTISRVERDAVLTDLSALESRAARAEAVLRKYAANHNRLGDDWGNGEGPWRCRCEICPEARAALSPAPEPDAFDPCGPERYPHNWTEQIENGRRYTECSRCHVRKEAEPPAPEPAAPRAAAEHAELGRQRDALRKALNDSDSETNRALRAEVERLKEERDMEIRSRNSMADHAANLRQRAEKAEKEREEWRGRCENLMDASKEGAWMARALDAERNVSDALSRVRELEAQLAARPVAPDTLARLEAVTERLERVVGGEGKANG